MFIHKVFLVLPKLSTAACFFGVQGNVRGALGQMRLKGSWLGSWFFGGTIGFREVEEEKDANKMRAEHYLIPQIILIVVTIDTYLSLKILQILTYHLP